MMAPMTQTIALIGCGEAGSTFSAAGRWHGSAFDVIGSRAAGLRDHGLTAAMSTADAVADADIVLSLVTARAALSVARAAAPALKSGALFCDLNSVAPQTKLAACAIVEAAGGRYVDVAVMAPVRPVGLAVPLLLSGPAVKDAWARLTALGFTNARMVSDDVGQASAIKMIRSVMIKGIEALTEEMMAAADAAGVADEVLASLDASERPRPWVDRAAYNLERMTSHGQRRAEEMEQSVATLRSLGVEPVMTEGTVRRQRNAARPASAPVSGRDAA